MATVKGTKQRDHVCRSAGIRKNHNLYETGILLYEKRLENRTRLCRYVPCWSLRSVKTERHEGTQILYMCIDSSFLS